MSDLFEQDEIKQKRTEMLNFEIEAGLASLEVGNVITDIELMEHIQNRRETYSNQQIQLDDIF